nr:MAG TPA: Major tail protein [Caudoviricetes sp.]
MSESPIEKVPSEVTRAGLDFNYAVWSPGTRIRLCKVSWDSEYRNIVDFGGHEKLKEYLAESARESVEISAMSYVRPGAPVKIPIPLTQAYEYNYIHVYNPDQPVSGDRPADYFYFIKDCKHIAPNTTEVMVQLDVWQTWGYGIRFGYGYVERGHIGIAASDAYDEFGRHILTTPEGFDLGNDYAIDTSYTVSLNRKGVDPNKVGYIITTTVSFMSSGGSVESPTLNSATGTNFEPMAMGVETYYVGSNEDLIAFLKAVSTKPWVSQGVISITACPPLNIVGNETPPEYPMLRGFNAVAKFAANMETYYVKLPIAPYQLASGWLARRYFHLRKFATFPYTYFTLTSYNGKTVMFKPELIAPPKVVGAGKNEFSLAVINIPFPPSARVAVYAPDYGKLEGTYEYQEYNLSKQSKPNESFDRGMFLDNALIISNLPSTALTNNSFLSFMAANHNSIAHQYASADWSQQRAMAGAANAYDNAMVGTRAGLQHANVAQWQNTSNMAIETNANDRRMWLDMANSGVSGLSSMLSGNVFGGAVSGIQGMGSAYLSNDIRQYEAVNHNTINNSAIQKNADIAARSNTQIADNNYSLAAYTAKGDYENAIAGINAKVQDAKLMQPTTSGQIGGDGFAFILNNGFKITWKTHCLQPNAMYQIGEFWLRYGYAINRFWKPTDLNIMTNFTYWKFKELNVVGANCTEIYKNAIRGIFEKGVTVWTNPAKIGLIDIADNKPRPGMKVELVPPTRKVFE